MAGAVDSRYAEFILNFADDHPLDEPPGAAAGFANAKLRAQRRRTCRHSEPDAAGAGHGTRAGRFHISIILEVWNLSR